MTPDTPQASVADVVGAGERLRMELLDALRGAEEAERAGVQIELMMFYGQAFSLTRDAALRNGPAGKDAMTGLRSAKVLHECVCGLAIFHLWQLAETPLEARDEYTRMTAHWHTLAGWVLTDGE